MGMRYRRSRGGRKKLNGFDGGPVLLPVLAVIFFPVAIFLWLGGYFD